MSARTLYISIQVVFQHTIVMITLFSSKILFSTSGSADIVKKLSFQLFNMTCNISAIIWNGVFVVISLIGFIANIMSIGYFIKSERMDFLIS